MLSEGPVSVARIDADCVVTEHGLADLRYLDMHARAQAIIAIADPAHRETLERAWHDIAQRI